MQLQLYYTNASRHWQCAIFEGQRHIKTTQHIFPSKQCKKSVCGHTFLSLLFYQPHIFRKNWSTIQFKLPLKGLQSKPVKIASTNKLSNVHLRKRCSTFSLQLPTASLDSPILTWFRCFFKLTHLLCLNSCCQPQFQAQHNVYDKNNLSKPRFCTLKWLTGWYKARIELCLVNNRR